MFEKLNNKMIQAYVAAQFKINNFFKKEDGAVDIVAIVVLMGIVVLVAIIFRKQLENLVKDLFTQIGGSAGNAIKPE